MDVKEKLIRAAGKLFAEHGFDGVSIRSICSAAGCNLGAIAYHFGGKEGLFCAVIEHRVMPLRKAFEAIVENERDPLEKLSELFRTYAFHILHEDPSLKAFFAEAMLGGHRLPDWVHEGMKWRNKVVGDIIRAGVKSGAFRKVNVERTTWAFFGMLAPYVLYQPFMDSKYRRGPYPKRVVEEIADSTLDVFMAGLKKS